MEDRTIVEADMPRVPDGEATRVIPAAPGPAAAYGDVTQHAVSLTCPVCSTPNVPGEQFCQDCGLQFSSISGEVEALPDASQMPRLIDAESGREFFLNPGVNSVGRDSGDLALGHPTVSRAHGRVILEAGQVSVEDLGSTNGTSVAGQAVRPGDRTRAYTGDVLKFGSIRLTLELPGEGARPVPAAPAAEAAPAAPEAPAERGAPVARVALGDGTEYPLYAGVNSLGRRSGNQIVLADAFASGRHAEIICEQDGSCMLVDLGSTNGTFVAGNRLAAAAPVPLEDGLVVTLGKTPLTFRAGGDGAGGDRTVMAASEPVGGEDAEASISGGGEGTGETAA